MRQKRIAICAAKVPFSRGGAEIHVEGLRDALIAAGHEVEVIELPFKWYPRVELLKSALAWRMVDISEADGRPIDLVICTKFPTWAVRHPNKIAWIIHQYRQAYDWFGTEYSDLTGTPDDLALRRRIQRIDARGLGECRALFANSQNTANRLQRYNGLTARPLHVPIRLSGLSPQRYDPFILSVSRLDRAKRIDILINAMRESMNAAKLIIVGDGPERPRLEQLARTNGLSSRITFAGKISDDELISYYNACRAVYYGPIDEDFGLVTLEAFAAAKPVVTIADSGGVLELVTHRESGLVADSPDPRLVAPLLDQLIESESMARTLGARGKALAENINWADTVETLLDAANA